MIEKSQVKYVLSAIYIFTSDFKNMGKLRYASYI